MSEKIQMFHILDPSGRQNVIPDSNFYWTKLIVPRNNAEWNNMKTGTQIVDITTVIDFEILTNIRTITSYNSPTYSIETKYITKTAFSFAGWISKHYWIVFHISI